MDRLFRPIDIASLALFRVLFGAVMCAGTTRFLLSGWVDTLFVEPRHFLKYYGFAWVQPWPEWGMYVHYTAMAVAALFLSIGLFYRLSAIAFFLLFTYAQLIDISNYLNHYYLVVLLAGLLIFLPADRAWSVDVWRRPEKRATEVPAWCVYLLRFQMGVVYSYAALAKLNAEWLLHARPLTLWMRARVHMPWIGAWLGEQWVAYAMSWAGFLYDSLIVVFLLITRTRPYAYAAVLLFHGLTWAFFDIGMFPFIMTTATLIFFSPSWPRSLWSWLIRRKNSYASHKEPVLAMPSIQMATSKRAVTAILMVYAVLQVAIPLRHYLYPGDVLWNEQGMRFAWKVLVREKNGSVTYHVRERRTGRYYQVSPHDYLTWAQVSEMSSQPDLILQLAHDIAKDFRSKGRGEVEVRAEAWVSLNGRKAKLMLDPTRDLTLVQDGLGIADWIKPGPTDAFGLHRQWATR